MQDAVYTITTVVFVFHALGLYWKPDDIRTACRVNNPSAV